MNSKSAFFLPSTLIINIDEIDDQHAGLFARLTAVKELCIESASLPAPEVAELLTALRIHFATEEKLAYESGLNFAAHACAHDKMLGAITRAHAEVREGKIDVFSVLRYIEYWFERHILEEDLSLGRNLQQVASGLFVSSQAFAAERSKPASTDFWSAPTLG